MSTDIAVGVDAGGTATVAASSRGGVFERRVSGGPANPSSCGVDAAAATIADTVRRLHERPHALYVGAAGAARADVADALERALLAALPGTARIAVTGDVECALRAAIPAGPGAVLIAGTGATAYAVGPERSALVGGNGYLLGDEGSAFWIGFSAVRLLARALEARAHLDETAALVQRALPADDRDGLLRAIYDGPLDVAKIAGLAPSIIAFAGKGNRASTKIVQQAAQELGDQLRAAVTQAGLADASPALAFAGGLLRENSLLSFLLETRVTNELPGAAIVRSRDEPARAALRFAEAMLGEMA